MPKSPILGGFSKSRSSNLSDNELVNLILELVETKDGVWPGALYNAAGLDLVGMIGNGPIRGVHVFRGNLYVVSGPQVWQLTPNGISTLLGTIGIEATPVSMFDNTVQMLIVDGVGANLAPGGYPLTGGVILLPSASSQPGGGLYAVNDTVTLLAASGTQSAFPVITITSIVNTPVVTFTLPNAGTTYATATGVATTNIQSHPGVGTGLTLNIVASNGAITAATVNAGGTLYAVNDTGRVGVGNGYYRVKSVSGGVVTAIIIMVPGTSYATTTGISTLSGVAAVPPNVGSGFTINITASGPITASSLATPGQNYAVGDVGFVSGGTGDATYLITAVGAFGVVTGFTVTQGGAIDAPAVSFTQQSTSGSGSGLILTSPTFGVYAGIVPVSLPFDNPVIGGVSDGFGLLMFLGSQNLAASNQKDLSTWDALSYGVSDSSPDNIVSLAVVHDEVYVLKQGHTEIWVDEGLSPFPFVLLPSTRIESGTCAPYSPAIVGEYLMYLTRNSQGQGIVASVSGSSLVPISTQAMVAEFDTYSNLGDAIGYGRQQGGHTFYVLTFPEADKTWQYDLTSSQLAGVPVWNRLATWTDGAWHRHLGNCFTPWRGSTVLTTQTVTYQAIGVALADGTRIANSSAAIGLPPQFFSAVFSVWVYGPTGTGGIVFADQSHNTTPALSITLLNPEIVVEAWDTSGNQIVIASYIYTTWANWVNFQVSIDTATRTLQVYANTVVDNVLVETMLFASSIAWASSNAINGAAPWFSINALAPIPNNFWNDGGVLARLGSYGYPTSPVSLPDGAVWDNGTTVGVVPGVIPDPSAPPVFFGIVTAAQLLALGGGNLPLTNPGSGSSRLWNDGGCVAVA